MTSAPDQLVSALRWRYATKKFDPARKIPKEVWAALEESLVLSPSSYGLQPWKFFVVEDAATRARLKRASWDQGQVTDADKFVVFAVRKDFGADDVERHVERLAEVRHASLASLEPLKKMMTDAVKTRSSKGTLAWASRQVYVALGIFLASAAMAGVDVCPMEGIETAQYDRVLGLSEQGYSVLCAAAVGYRSTDDAAAHHTKVRFPRSEVVVHV